MARRKTKKGTADASATESAIGSSRTTGGPTTLSGTAGMQKGFVEPVAPRTFDSGHGYVFLDRAHLSTNPDRVQAIWTTNRYNALGWWLTNSAAIITTSTAWQVDVFWENLYANLVHMGEAKLGYRHTPYALTTDATQIRFMVEHYVTAVANVRALWAVLHSATYNGALQSCRDTLKTYRSRLDYQHRVLSSVPMPDMFRELAVMRGTPVIPYAGGPVFINTYSHEDLDYAATYTPHDWSSDSHKGPTPADATDLGNFLDDIDGSILELTGQTGNALTDADVRDILALFQMMGIGKGLPELGTISESAQMYDEYLSRNAGIYFDTSGLGADTFCFWPVLKNSAATLMTDIPRRGKGAPNDWILSGQCNLWAAGGNTTTLVDQAESDDIVFWGHFAPVSLAYNFAGYVYTVEDGWEYVFIHHDMSAANELQGIIGGHPWASRHQFFDIMVAEQVSEEHRFELDPVDWSFSQPANTISEIYRSMLATAWGVPVS
jgi:hypothetical protein